MDDGDARTADCSGGERSAVEIIALHEQEREATRPPELADLRPIAMYAGGRRVKFVLYV
jgi:hypothetical protein